MTRLQSVVRLVLASLVLVGVLGQQTDDATASGSRPAPPGGSAGPRVGGVVLNPDRVAGGTAVNGTVILVEPAPPSGAMVTIVSSDTKVAVVPAKIVVPAGASSASFVVRTSGQAAQPVAVDISAQLGAAQPAMARLVVTPSPQTPGYDLKPNLK